MYIINLNNKGKYSQLGQTPLKKQKTGVNREFNRQKSKKIKDRDIYTDIFDTVKDNLELKNVFKELWELKTCIHILLSEE